MLKVESISPLNRNQSASINYEMNYPFTAGDVPVLFCLIYSPQPDPASQYDCNSGNNQVTNWAEEYPFYPYSK